MSEGTKGGDSRPGSAPEIKKLPRSTCGRCGLEGPKPMVDKGKCVNQTACDRRFERKVKAKGGK